MYTSELLLVAAPTISSGPTRNADIQLGTEFPHMSSLQRYKDSGLLFTATTASGTVELDDYIESPQNLFLFEVGVYNSPTVGGRLTSPVIFVRFNDLPMPMRLNAGSLAPGSAADRGWPIMLKGQDTVKQYRYPPNLLRPMTPDERIKRIKFQVVDQTGAPAQFDSLVMSFSLNQHTIENPFGTSTPSQALQTHMYLTGATGAV